MTTTRVALLTAMTGALLGLAACASESSAYGPNPYYPQEPFQQTNPGSMDIAGREAALPNSPGYHEGSTGYSTPSQGAGSSNGR